MKIAQFVAYLATMGIKLWLDEGQLRWLDAHFWLNDRPHHVNIKYSSLF